MDFPWQIALLAFAAVALYSLTSRRRLRLPPGPKGVPLLGNLFDMPRSHEWLKYAEWSTQYDTDIIHLYLAGTHVIAINSAETAVELFYKRASLYSDRARTVMLSELIGWDFSFTFMNYGAKWKEQRRVFHQHYTGSAVVKYHPQMLKGVHTCLGRLLDQQDRFIEHLRHMAGALILSITYGIEVLPEGDPYISTAEEALSAVAACGNAGAYLGKSVLDSYIESIPILKHLPDWLPGMSFKRQAATWRKPTLAMADRPFAYVKQEMANGTAIPSVVSSLLEHLEGVENKAEMETIISHAAGTAYAGGADTSVSSLGTFVLAMVLHPEIQRKAQIELDRVLEGNRLPDFEDEPNLPYITSIYREVLRWQPVDPLAIPHRLKTDDRYKDYHLPAGSIVVSNVWAILHDKVRYPDPDVFNPDRFLDKDGQLDPTVPNSEAFAFGFGRRVCPGRHLAAASVWLSIASILATFNLRKAKDRFGHDIEPRVEYTSGLISHPLPFKCVFQPRSLAAEALIRTHAHDAS